MKDKELADALENALEFLTLYDRLITTRLDAI